MQESMKEKLRKHVKITSKELGYGGDTLTIGDGHHRTNKSFEELTEEECQQIAELMELDKHIELELQRKEKSSANLRKNIKPKSKKKPPEANNLCGCGCGALVKRLFKPGHDAKHKSKLRKAAEEGNENAKKELQERGW